MRICPKKFSSLKAESGMSDADLAVFMGMSAAGLCYHVRKIKSGSVIKENVVHNMLGAFGRGIGRKIAIRELVVATDLPRKPARNRRKAGATA